MGTKICSATMCTFPFDNFNVNKLYSGVLYYWIFLKDISLSLFLRAYFPEWRKIKQQSEWKQTLVLSYFSIPQTVISLSPFISWCSLLLCLFYIPIEKNHWKIWDLLVKIIFFYMEYITLLLGEATHKIKIWNFCVLQTVSSFPEFQQWGTYQLVFFCNYIKGCTKLESVTVSL